MTRPWVDRIVQRWGGSGVAVVAAALPWERFQLIPGTELTLVKVGGTITILAGMVSWLRTRGVSIPRTGILPCIALFVLAAVISLPRSYDSEASSALLRMYSAYAVFFFAMATFVRTPQSAFRLLGLYALSAVCVGVLTVLAANGLVWPAHWDTAFWPQQRLLEEFRDGQPMRLTAAGLDFNQASLYLLVGLAYLLFGRFTSRAAVALQVVCSGMLVAAIALSMSRSGVAIALVLVAAAIIVRTRGRVRVAVIGGVLLSAGAGVWLAGDFAAMFATRAQGGTVYAEGSAVNRFEVYRIALLLVPRHALTGAGLGASQAAMRASEYAEGAVMAIHSMPLLLLIELGVLGLVAYAWIWWRVFRNGVLALRRKGDPENRTLATVFASMAAAIFAMLLVQPLMVLPLYPFVLGLGFGPVTSAATDRARRPAISNGLAAAAIVVTLACAIENRWAFQRTAVRTEAFADTMASGLRAERAGRWEDARSAYISASELGRNLDRRSYFGEAEALIDLEPLYESFDAKQPSNPEAVAWFAEGRILLAEGRLRDAEMMLIYAWSVDPQFEYIRFYLAEAYWSAGMIQDAIAHYAQFRALSDDGQGLVTRIRTAMAAQSNEANPETPNDLVGRASYARRDGRWDDAVALAKEIVGLDSHCAEAHYLLGVDAELSGGSGLEQYRAAVAASPHHLPARRALERRSETPPAEQPN